MMVPGTDMWLGTGVYIDSIDQDMAVIRAEIEAITQRTLLIAVGCFVGWVFLIILVVVGVVVRRTTGPIRQITEIARQIARGEVNQKMDIQQQDEIGQLAEAFRQMTA
jgi:methyl-accepting chemotaxis protein